MADFQKNLDELQKNLKDAAYIGIGLGVLTFQRAQVARRDLEAQLRQRVNELEDRLDPVVDQVTERLPAQARQAATSARTRAKDARQHLLGSAA